MIAEQSNPHITEIRLERFKAAFKPDPIYLGPFNVIIGRNGSGKSTLIEALQWLDTTIRRDAREACDRYYGVRDLINLRSQTKPLYFRIALTWAGAHFGRPLRYKLRVNDDNASPSIAEEELDGLTKKGKKQRAFIKMEGRERRFAILHAAGLRRLGWVPHTEPDRLALPLLASQWASNANLGFLQGFWERAVFLRLSPNRLAFGSPATRKSFEPLLDEEGQTLPALLNELNSEQKAALVRDLRQMVHGIEGVDVSKSATGRDARVHYSLLEKMPYQGRSGRSQFKIPAWMLSEGTRRITAMLALLVRDPPPSLLCIEEIENGLDPWTVVKLLGHLKSAADRGTQVILTTHSPWLLDHVSMDSILHVRRIEGETKYENFASKKEVREFADSIPAGTRYLHMEES